MNSQTLIPTFSYPSLAALSNSLISATSRPPDKLPSFHQQHSGVGMAGMDETGYGFLSKALPVLAYCGCSIAMTLANKFILSSWNFKMGFLLLSVQVIMAAFSCSS